MDRSPVWGRPDATCRRIAPAPDTTVMPSETVRVLLAERVAAAELHAPALSPVQFPPPRS